MAWAVQRVDERWLATDYGWTDREEDMLRFKSCYEAQAQVDRLVTGGISCRAIAVSAAYSPGRDGHPAYADTE